jgi:hypothetical protein
VTAGWSRRASARLTPSVRACLPEFGVGELVDSPVEIADFPGEWPAYTYRDRYVIWSLMHRILGQLWNLAGGAPGR